jgi:ribA/ribD-fused uncharacterized protein
MTKTTVAAAGNTLAPALAVLRTKGYSVQPVNNQPGVLQATCGEVTLLADDLLMLEDSGDTHHENPSSQQLLQMLMQDEHFVEDLRTRFNAGERLKFTYFWGHQPKQGEVSAACFSQWFMAPFVVSGDRYLTAEHFMMAEKARLFEDESTRSAVLQAPNAGAAKALGRQVRNFDEVVWKSRRFGIVCSANEAKFAQHPELMRFLMQTGTRILVEASPVDRIWGIGMSQDDERAGNPNLWCGLNLLGFALMHVRGTSAVSDQALA